MKKIFIFLISLITIAILFLIIPKQNYQEGYDIEVLIKNLNVPWAIDFLPDNTLIFTERNGKVSIFKEGNLKTIGDINVYQRSESGLLGLAVDPEFKNNNFIYLYYTHENGNRVSRFRLDEKLEDEFILLDNIPSARFHDGGRIKFGLDNRLYITTGDATNPSSAQDINSLAGKILRINKDGSIPKDNPFNNFVFSYGHRNPQGIAWNPITNDLYSSEHGPTKNDEINIIKKGMNYGWPAECDKISSEYENPIRCFSEFTLAPSGIAFYKNDLYIAGLRGTQIRKITFDKNYKNIIKEEELFTNLGRIREAIIHGNYLYIATNNKDGRGISNIDDDKILRIKINN